MHTFFKKFFVALAVLFSVAATVSFTSPAPAQARADIGGCDYLLGMVSWDCHVTKPTTGNPNNQDIVVKDIILIASNVLTDLTVIATYLVIGYVIYGGYLYMFSNGDASKVAGGKKTITHAFIGLAIVLLSNVALNTARIAMLGTSGSFAQNCVAENASCVNPVDLISNLLTWFIGTAGVVALAFVFIGGISYMTSSGDSAKLQKAKNTITYALIGLAVVALSLAVTGFVSNLIKGADGTSYVQQLIIARSNL